MYKFKVSHKNNQILIKKRLDRKKEVNFWEVQVFQTKLIRGLMRPTTEGRKIYYSAPHGISLQKYLKNGITKNDFFLVFAQIIEVTKKIERNGFDINHLVLDLRYVFINELTKEVSFIYQPVKNLSDTVNMFSFLFDVIYSSVFQLNEDIGFVNDLVYFLRQMQFFSAMEIENYVLKVYPEVYQQVKRQVPGQSQILNSRQWEENVPKQESNEEGTTLLCARREESFEEEEGTSLLLEEDDMGTTLLQDSVRVYPYLVRISTGERIEIVKELFWIGKDKNRADYVVDNNTVSRLHVALLSQGEHFFVKDNHSTNKTYVNGVIIEPEINKEIKSGDTLTLSNEVFEFHIEE